MITIELQQLINQLEAVFSEGWRVPLTERRLVDEEACRRIVDQMRVSVPDMIKQAERTLGERDRIIAQANEEASRIVQIAREQASDLIENHEIVAKARARANDILAATEQEASAMRAEADDYALSSLGSLAEQLEQVHRQVENGIQALLGSAASGQKDS